MRRPGFALQAGRWAPPQGQARRHGHRPGPRQQRGCAPRARRTLSQNRAERPGVAQGGRPASAPGATTTEETQATATVPIAAPRPSGRPSRHQRQDDAPRPGRDMRLPAGQQQGPTASQPLASGPGATLSHSACSMAPKAGPSCRHWAGSCPSSSLDLATPGPWAEGRAVTTLHGRGREAGVSSPGQMGGAGQERLAELRCSRCGHSQQTPTGVSLCAGHCPRHLVTWSSRPPF